MFYCYLNTCPFKSSDAEDILTHTIETHSDTFIKFSIRHERLHPSQGYIYKQSVHFDIKLSDIQSRIDNDQTPVIDIENNLIRFKRKPSHAISTHTGNIPSATQTENSTIYELIPGIIEKIRDLGRLSDFESLLQAVHDGKLQNNIALHLLLDIGQFFGLSDIRQMKYSQDTIHFWLTIQKLFKGRGLNFFQGYKHQGTPLTEDWGPDDCRINFVVPSKPILSKAAAEYTIDAERPGILQIPLTVFAEHHSGCDIKLSIDGKKLASGFGTLGEEDLGGFEQAPTLIQRRARLKDELDTLDSITDSLSGLVHDDSLSDIPVTISDELKEAFYATLNNMSQRIRELKEMIAHRKAFVTQLLSKVCEYIVFTQKYLNTVNLKYFGSHMRQKTNSKFNLFVISRILFKFR